MRNYMKRILVMICACFLTLSFAKEKIDIISLDLQKDIQKKQSLQDFIEAKHADNVRKKLEFIEQINAATRSKSDTKFQDLYREKIEYYNENGYPEYNSHATFAGTSLRCEYFTVTMCDSYGDGWNGNVLTIGGESFVGPSVDLEAGECAEECYNGQSDAVVTCDGGSWQGEISWSITDADGNVVFSGGAPFSDCWGSCADGCTDPNANNYDPSAFVDDGSCEYNYG